MAEASKYQDWRDIEEIKLEMWEDCKGVVLQKNKKREFRVEFTEPTLADGRYSMKIEVTVHKLLQYNAFC